MAKFIQKRFRPIETVIALCLIALLTSVVYNRYEQLAFRSRLNVVRMDIQNMRLAVKLYYIREAHFPGHLMELSTKGYLQLNQSENDETIGTHLLNGRLVDAFGKPYEYDNKTGEVQLNRKTADILSVDR